MISTAHGLKFTNSKIAYHSGELEGLASRAGLFGNGSAARLEPGWAARRPWPAPALTARDDSSTPFPAAATFRKAWRVSEEARAQLATYESHGHFFSAASRGDEAG